MTISNEQELEGMKHAGHVVARTLAALKSAVEPGITPAELDKMAGEIFAQYGALSAPRLEYGAPGDVVKIDVTPNVHVAGPSKPKRRSAASRCCAN